jgi:uncharacterized protein
MTISLKDQLLGLGFKAAPVPERKPDERKHEPRKSDSRRPDDRRPTAGRDARKPDTRDARGPRRDGGKPGERPRPPADGKPSPGGGRPAHASRPAAKPPRSQEEMDLAKAYAIRAQKEKDERIEAERIKQEEARVRREAKAKLSELLKDKGLNVADAEIARHFEYGGKIKRVYVTAEQLKALNAGELGVVQDGGRYLVVTAAVLAEAETVFAQAIALKVDPNAPPTDDPYSDPAYQVPDDLVW